MLKYAFFLKLSVNIFFIIYVRGLNRRKNVSVSLASNFFDYQKAVSELKFQSAKSMSKSTMVNDLPRKDYILSEDFDKPVVLELADDSFAMDFSD